MNAIRHQLHLKTFRFALLVVVSVLLTASAFGDSRKALRQADKALRAGDFEKAEQIYREILKKDDHDLDARLGLSHALLKQLRLQDSFDHAARVLAVNPLSARGHALLGSAILAAGDFRLSVEEFRTALTLDDNNAMAVAGLAMIDFYENRTADALAKLRRAVAIDSDEPDYIFSLGQTAARSERYKEAADAYERFLIIAPRTDADRRARIRGLIDFLRYLGQQASLYDVNGAGRTILPFEALDNRPVIRLRINGSKEQFRFVLDTGSGMSVLSEQTARKLGLKPVARGGMARAIGGGGRFEIVYGYLESITIGEVRVEHVPVYIRQFYDSHNPVDGYLGIAALARLLTTVDYGTLRMTFTRRTNSDLAAIADQTLAPDAAASRTRAGIDVRVRTTSSGFLSGEVTIEGIKKPLNFIIDTGASVSVLSQRAAELEGAAEFIQDDRMRVFGAAGVADNVRTALLPKVAIGSFAREKINAAILDLDPINETAGFQQNGILGGNFLRYFRVIFDFQKAIVRLEPLETTTTAGETIPHEATLAEP
jgi:predicted aspartyl protease/thioredoxin-like negative regulator of GroEL